MPTAIVPTTEGAFVLSRIIDAPRARVFQAWTDAEQLGQWWGPKGLSITVAKLELRPGGLFHYAMHTSDGHTLWGKFVYREITAPERLVWINSFSDEAAGITRHPLSVTWPLEMLSTVTFSEQDGKTLLMLEGTPINETEEERATFKGAFDSLTQGFTGTLDQLAEYLANS